MEIFHPRTALEERKLIVERDAYRQAWHDAWHRDGLDLLLTVPHALPAMPKDPETSSQATLVAANYAFLYNVVRISSVFLLLNADGSRICWRSSTALPA